MDGTVLNPGAGGDTIATDELTLLNGGVEVVVEPIDGGRGGIGLRRPRAEERSRPGRRSLPAQAYGVDTPQGVSSVACGDLKIRNSELGIGNSTQLGMATHS